MDVGESLRDHATVKLEESINKYLDRVTDATIVFAKQSHHGFRADININAGTHQKIMIRGSSESNDVYTSFGEALEKVDKQLRRYKRKLKDHTKEKFANVTADLRTVNARKYIISNDNRDEIPEDHEHSSLVIAEKSTKVETLTVSEAVMHMELAELPALMFFNKVSGRPNVVYRRVDGNISWIDPEV